MPQQLCARFEVDSLRTEVGAKSLASMPRLAPRDHLVELGGTLANPSGDAPRAGPLRLAGYPPLLAAPSGGHDANDHLTTRGVGRGADTGTI